MDDSIPSISTGTVGSRFVSSNDIETAKARRDEQWKAAYARQEITNPYATRADRNIPGWVKNPLLSR